MSTYLRKCLDIAPTAIITPGAANDYRLLRQQPWWPALRATTSHLRLLADWPSIQPEGDKPPGGGRGQKSGSPLAADCLAALDGQMQAATEDGMDVIVMPYRYPAWANGTEGIVVGSQQDGDFFPQDRVSRVAPYRDWVQGRALRPGYRALEYRLPPDGHAIDSPWGRYVAFLWDRYLAQAPRYGRAASFETVNEPNLQIWPQRTTIDTPDVYARFESAGTRLASAPAVADMMVTMDALARAHGLAASCLAPSTSDSDVSTAPRVSTVAHRSIYATSDDPFTEALLRELDDRGFAGGDHWIWSYHNYSDVERAQSHAVYLRQVLDEGGWTGRRLDGGPELYGTEGGCRLVGVVSRFAGPLGHALSSVEKLDYQARILAEALARHHYAKGVGAGVGMVTQYTTYADTRFDDGLLEAASAGGAPRPALAAWSAVPEYIAPVAPRPDWRPQA
jgi:hypothetical protein